MAEDRCPAKTDRSRWLGKEEAIRTFDALLALAALTGAGVLAVALHRPATVAAAVQPRRIATLRVATHYNAQQIAPLVACFRGYEARHPGVRIVHQQVSYQDFFQTVMISRAGRAPIDIYNLYTIWSPQLIATGALAPPPADIRRFVLAAYTPATVAAATIRGRLWGIPSAVSAYQLVYNKRLFAAADLHAPPRTPGELIRDAAAITRKNRQGNILIGGYAFGPQVSDVTHTFYATMYAAGVAPYTQDLRGTNLRSPAAVRILTDQAQLFRRGITSNTVGALQFAQGAVGMAVIANWQKETLKDALGDRFDETVGVAPIPTDGPGGTMIYSFLWSVDSASPAKREAWNLLRWLNGPRGNGGLSCVGAMLADIGDLTGNRSDLAAMRARIADPFSRRYVAALNAPGAVSQPNLWHAEEVDRLLKYYLELAWAGRMSPAAALAEADARIRDILAEQPN